jgi:hypothetical protein
MRLARKAIGQARWSCLRLDEFFEHEVLGPGAFTRFHQGNPLVQSTANR